MSNRSRTLALVGCFHYSALLEYSSTGYPDYARTLREWGYRFRNNFSSHIQPALQKQYPKLTETDLDIFRRKWICTYFKWNIGALLRCHKIILLTVKQDLQRVASLTMCLLPLERYEPTLPRLANHLALSPVQPECMTF